MSQPSVIQSARKAFGNVSNVKSSFKNTIERGKPGLVSGIDISSPSKEQLKKPKDLKNSCVSASCKKTNLDKAKSTKALKDVKSKQHPATCVKEGERSGKSKNVIEPIPENFYPMHEDEIDDCCSSPIDIFGPTDDFKFDEEEDLPQFMKKPLKFELDLDLL